MQCPNHPRNEVTGYCSVCGAFGCSECLKKHEGQLLCARHYRPVARQLEEERRHDQLRKRHARQRLVVRYKDGRLDYGMCYALNPRENSFYLDRADLGGVTTGETIQVRFSDLKAVFSVKSFDGKFDPLERFRQWTPEGEELVVQFEDGEVLRGSSLHRYDPDEPRFVLIPKDLKSNNLSILIESSAVARIYTPEEFEAAQAEKTHAQAGPEVAVGLSQEEVLGDFYFETRNYPAAHEQYALALKKTPQSVKLRKKLLVSQYNIGVQHIKRHEYPEALSVMQKVLQSEPGNAHAQKKVLQLRRIIEKGGRPKQNGPPEDLE